VQHKAILTTDKSAKIALPSIIEKESMKRFTITADTVTSLLDRNFRILFITS
tara:strand:+ start:1214 stop:1369 length:156 start_codon:yes stop_codon:yes gene_type:complete